MLMKCDWIRDVCQPKLWHAFRKSLQQITVLLCANASGTHKIKLLAVRKSVKPRVFKIVQYLPIVYKHQKYAWMRKNIFCKYYFENFIPSVHNTFKKKCAKCILILENCTSYPHENELVSDCGYVFVIFHQTWLLQFSQWIKVLLLTLSATRENFS